jgi:hypothetical protein|tara:strand:- start:555 stop:800 length:246 start_codon:yes stop_codon:yes gene_type:complete
MTIAQLLKHDFTKGLLSFYDSNGNRIYYETPDGHWVKYEFDSNGNKIYSEKSNGDIIDNRHKAYDGKVVEIDGKKYKLEEI